MTNTTPPPHTSARHPVALNPAGRAALTLLWVTPLAIAAWGWSALPTRDPIGAPTRGSMAAHLAITLTVAAVAVAGLIGAAVLTRIAGAWYDEPDTTTAGQRLPPLSIVLLLSAIAYAVFAIFILLQLFSGVFPPAPLLVPPHVI